MQDSTELPFQWNQNIVDEFTVRTVIAYIEALLPHKLGHPFGTRADSGNSMNSRDRALHAATANFHAVLERDYGLSHAAINQIETWMINFVGACPMDKVLMQSSRWSLPEAYIQRAIDTAVAAIAAKGMGSTSILH